MTGKKVDKFSVAKVTSWYFKSFCDMTEEAFMFPKFKDGVPQWQHPVSYSMARQQLIKEKDRLNLTRHLTWHSGRIETKTRAAKQGVSRNIIMKGGNWVSNSVDVYMTVRKPGAEMGDTLMKDF